MKALLWSVAVLALVLLGSAFLLPKGNAPRAAALPAPAATVETTIDNFTFGSEITVARGTTVTWLNRDDMPHTVVSNDKSFASQPLDTGDRFSHRFDKPGTYVYFCSIHPRMTGQVVVR